MTGQAGEAGDRGKVGDALGQGIGGERAEAHVVAADRQQHEVDRALAQWRRAPGLDHALHRDLRAAVQVDGQRVGRVLRAPTAADELAQLVELRANLAAGNLARAFARIHVEEQPSVTSEPEQVKLASVTERWRFSSASSIATRNG